MKIKKVFKNRIFLCIFTALVVGTVSVSATTYFASSDVTYDNSESGLESNNVQGAIDELYETCSSTGPINGGNGILKNEEIVTSGDGLYEDEYDAGKYTYKGANPNNYITFNNDRAGWRIISIKADGTIKIIKNNSSISNAWDTSYSNNWARPVTLNTYLNGTYYNSLTDSAKSQIVSDYFSIGSVTNDNDDLIGQINTENNKKWYGKVALATVSEFLRANSNKNSCETFYDNQHNFYTCYSTNWMYLYEEWWTLSADSRDDSFVFFVDYLSISGYAEGGNSSYAKYIHPVVNLSASISLAGSGTESDPYTIIE